MAREYRLNTASELGQQQMDCIQAIMDTPTTTFLEPVVKPGSRCLEIGAGGGSVAGWMAQQAGPTGAVVAVDLDPDLIAEHPVVEILRHDITDGVPGNEPYDVIHARWVLMHMSRREEVFKTLVDALAPGGWLVLGEVSSRPRGVESAPSQADRDLFERVQSFHQHELAEQSGTSSFEWAKQVDGRMEGAGLVNITGMEFSQTMTGGTEGCLLMHNYTMQTEPLLLDLGLPADDVKRYRELMLDPRFRAWFFRTVYTR
ncbi:MAG: class I SAM-dependent methyltransferase, partial [Stackebrandtia sp.]